MAYKPLSSMAAERHVKVLQPGAQALATGAQFKLADLVASRGAGDTARVAVPLKGDDHILLAQTKAEYKTALTKGVDPQRGERIQKAKNMLAVGVQDLAKAKKLTLDNACWPRMAKMLANGLIRDRDGKPTSAQDLMHYIYFNIGENCTSPATKARVDKLLEDMEKGATLEQAKALDVERLGGGVNKFARGLEEKDAAALKADLLAYETKRDSLYVKLAGADHAHFTISAHDLVNQARRQAYLASLADDADEGHKRHREFLLKMLDRDEQLDTGVERIRGEGAARGIRGGKNADDGSDIDITDFNSLGIAFEQRKGTILHGRQLAALDPTNADDLQDLKKLERLSEIEYNCLRKLMEQVRMGADGNRTVDGDHLEALLDMELLLNAFDAGMGAAVVAQGAVGAVQVAAPAAAAAANVKGKGAAAAADDDDDDEAEASPVVEGTPPPLPGAAAVKPGGAAASSAATETVAGGGNPAEKVD